MDETVLVVCFFGALFVGCLWVANYLIEETRSALNKYFNRRYCTRQESLELAGITGQVIGQLLVSQELLRREVDGQHLIHSQHLRFAERKCDEREVARIHGPRPANMEGVEVRRSPRTPRRVEP
jgi:hypothetical protein